MLKSENARPAGWMRGRDLPWQIPTSLSIAGHPSATGHQPAELFKSFELGQRTVCGAGH
jgi:hypothetical protein